MTLTPRQIAAYLEFNDKLDRIDRANDLAIAAIGAQGDQKAIEKRLKEWAG
jgi:aminoglycoside phosphotransferase family enzyme